MSDPHNHNLSRRDIFRHASLTAGAMALWGDAPTFAAPPDGPAGRQLSETNHELDADVIVVGGGMSGVCAAIAAARNGSRVILVQDRPVLGGNASSEIRMHVCGADRSGAHSECDDRRESGIIEEIRLEDAVRNPQRSASMYDLLLYEWIARETDITLLLNTTCIDVRMQSPQQIGAISAIRPATEDIFTITARQFIDCTGDGRLGAEAGAAFRVGREARADYSESLAPEQADNKTMGSSLLFITRPHEKPMPFIAPDWIHRFPRCEDLPHRSHRAWEYGFWWVEWGGEIDTIKDNERIRDELLAAALGVWDHIKNSGQHPESSHWALEWIGFVPGKRESRRFIGGHTLIQEDVQKGRQFEDGVAYGGWPIDLHPPGGIYSTEPPFTPTPVPLYNIPLRCLCSRDIQNLMFAGRNISASHVAFASTRVMATCAVIGQAAGTAAAMCCKQNCQPPELDVAALQQQLLKDDAYIVGATNNDPTDHARLAMIRASSETDAGKVDNVINGITRGCDKQSNRWISDPNQPMPQWIELRFAEPRRVAEIHLTFDTGLHRPLTLTHSDAFNARMVRAPQPETVRDYELKLLDGDTLKVVASIKGNHQRKRIHRLEPCRISGVRIDITATNGGKSARLFEIRAHG